MEQKEVGLIDIEKELNQLWELQPNVARMKACLFNLIIYTHEPRRTAYFKDIARMIIELFPCRIMFIQTDNSSDESFLKVSVSTEIGLPNSGIACDYISIEASMDRLNRVPFIILPHFVPDLPIYLLWGQDPTTEITLLPHLQAFATRLIFDSECSESLQQFSQNMLTRLHANHVEITDMNWARVGGWREILAQVFDGPERIQQLDGSKTIKIVYNNRPSDLFFHPETQAIYLQAWLAVQLNWSFEKIEQAPHVTTLHYQSSKEKIEVCLEGKNSGDLPSEEIIAFEASDETNFLYSLVRKGERQVFIHCNTIDRCELPFTLLLPNIRSGRSFMQEIFYQKTSKHYFKMLQLISRIPWRQHG